MILLVGKPCSGKDTIQNELTNMGIGKVIPYTTRPPRKNETNNTAYHFITKDEFKEKEKNNFFIETTSYNVASGDTWYYGTAMKDLIEDKVMVASPYALKKLKKMESLNPISFFILVSEDTIFERIKQRGDNITEIKRRLKDDTQIFREIFNNDVDFVIRNDGINIKPRVLAEMILCIYKKAIKEK